MSDAAHQQPAAEDGSLGDAASHFTTEGGTPAGVVQAEPSGMWAANASVVSRARRPYSTRDSAIWRSM